MSRPRNYQQYAFPLTKTYDSIVSKSLRVLDDLTLDSRMDAIRQANNLVRFYFFSIFFYFLILLTYFHLEN